LGVPGLGINIYYPLPLTSVIGYRIEKDLGFSPYIFLGQVK